MTDEFPFTDKKGEERDWREKGERWEREIGERKERDGRERWVRDEGEMRVVSFAPVDLT